LASAYRRCLELAIAHDCRSVAFPALSTGAYGYPMRAAADVALDTVSEFLRGHGRPALVRFVLWGKDAMAAFTESLEELRQRAHDASS
jgi:O-acetyl-ADP-ribose deacetylase (regulator of RNase III)